MIQTIIKVVVILVVMIVNHYLFNGSPAYTILATLGIVFLTNLGELGSISKYEKVIKHRENQLRQRDEVIANLKRKLEQEPKVQENK